MRAGRATYRRQTDWRDERERQRDRERETERERQRETEKERETERERKRDRERVERGRTGQTQVGERKMEGRGMCEWCVCVCVQLSPCAWEVSLLLSLVFVSACALSPRSLFRSLHHFLFLSLRVCVN
jgi:Flp pilus assembly protein TadB